MSERRVLYLDLVGGAAGDMILGALVDAGASFEAVQAAVASLSLEGVTLQKDEVHPAGLRALQIDVMVRGVLGDSDVVEGGPKIVVPHDHSHDHSHDHAHDDHGHDHDHGHGHGAHRPYRVIVEMLGAAPLDEKARALALEAFRLLAEAESLAHGVPIDEVVFHEVGGDDAIADIVGASTALALLAVDEVVVSPAPLGRGLTKGAHGPIPLPGPATLHLLKGAPTVETDLKGETVTPTGAALLRAFGDRFGPIPSMTIDAVGVGAGHKRWADRPNVVRALVGRSSVSVEAAADDLIVETNIDDMSPELVADLERALLAAGAYDVWSTPANMKKGRAGLVVHALGRRSSRDALVGVFFEHSTTLGVRVYEVERHRADRRVETVETPYGAVRVKISPRAGAPLIAPEHDDVERCAAKAGVATRVVYEAALRGAWNSGEGM